MADKLITPAVDERKRRLKDLKDKGSNKWTKAEMEEALQLILDKLEEI